MKLDLKSILLLIFFIGFGIFASKWYFDGDTHRKENKELKTEIKAIQHQRDSLADERLKIDERYKKLEVELSQSQSRVAELNQKLAKNQQELTDAKSKLNNLNKGLSETKKKIKDLKSNPIKRTGDALLNSIKEKTK